ncbi:kinase-like domain-containing protein [Aspergillus pseudonomiae]|uniref:non-specific serine/threonine protein kinase n=1 Tax=Aspergillus pseudonomiae TaxID=1506151 RepID=A0A5N7CW13_9EURO|nr:kinase-like domain-containing protein [Aspergillus pseudonomiae]KAB8256812.1 kinase-like domain-containing protein [Aspergillus pseudonomiae]KAE8397773.1 kinase-like domain-containing protein [Aspergillus pseudonomiae]
MFHLLRQLLQRSVLRRAPSPARHFSQTNFLLLDTTQKFEEETLPWYSPDRFYPVNIGEIFRSRYQVVGKLGYGGYSTVWLCRDLQQHGYVTLKVCERDSAEGIREMEVYNHLNSLNARHDGATLIRTALDNFQISSLEGNYQCFIHIPLGISLYDFRNQLAAKVLPEKILKLTLLHVLLALDFLHTEAGIIHTDIQEKNIMLGIEDKSILADFEEGEKSNPSPRKIVGGRITYSSRKLRRTKQHGRPILCDFGQARFGSSTYFGDIQPYIYRAPEVILQMPWDHKVDIWNLGVVTWDLFQKGHLFYGRDTDKQNSDGHHLAELIALLGLPPKDMLRKSDYAAGFFDDEGNWKGVVQIPSMSLEDLEGNLEGSQRKLFLQFMRKMLRWRPEERESAKELLSDPWLRSP